VPLLLLLGIPISDYSFLIHHIFNQDYKCGNNGQGNQVDNLYSIRIKSTLTQHQTVHLHLYQINGRIRLGQAELIRSGSKQKYQQFYVKTENWQEKNVNKEISGKIQWNTEHDKIIQYFPHAPLFA
jgi:hypothetical protein